MQAWGQRRYCIAQGTGWLRLYLARDVIISRSGKAFARLFERHGGDAGLIADRIIMPPDGRGQCQCASAMPTIRLYRQQREDRTEHGQCPLHRHASPSLRFHRGKCHALAPAQPHAKINRASIHLIPKQGKGISSVRGRDKG
jgi:hypothetical protein